MDATRRCMNLSWASTMLQAEPSDDIAVAEARSVSWKRSAKRECDKQVQGQVGSQVTPRKQTTGQVLKH